jgi:tRNA(Ile2) C34 agmatinyltransferase TiaS
MSETVPTCPDCGTSSLSSCGRNYWCHDCGRRVTRDEAVERQPREWADRSPTRGLAKRLDKADPDEVSVE